MALLRINKHPAPRQLFIFAATWLVFAGAVGWTQWARDRATLAWFCWALALVMPAVGAVWREGLRLFYVGLCYATYPIGFVVSSLVLALIYYAVLTPIGLILRVCRHDPLQRRPASRADSYWHPRPAARPPESYFRQQ